MTTTTATVFAAPRPSVPLLGTLVRKTDASTAILLVLIAVLAVWGGAIALFGALALFLPAVAVSPVMIALLVWITFG